MDSKAFDGITIDSKDAKYLSDTDPRKIAIEHNVKKACICFVPFTNLNELRKNGDFLSTFQHWITNNKLSERHKSILANTQECRNSLNAGRPKDALERVTSLPKEVKDRQNQNLDDYNDDPVDSYYDELLVNMEAVVGPNDLSFRDNNGKLNIDTSIITRAGSKKCGRTLIKTPKLVASCPGVISLSSKEDKSMSSNQDKFINKKTIGYLKYDDLYTLHSKRYEVVVTDDESKRLPYVTGTLDNIRSYAENSFGGDNDQEFAFILTSSAFVMSLHERCFRKEKKRKRDKIHEEILKLHNRKHQFIAFLSGAGGTGKSKVIHTVKEYCKKLCDNLNVEFNQRTIVVTALTGVAAVSINGETTSKACGLNSKNEVSFDEEWENTIMIIVDEISFASKSDIEKLNENLRLKMDLSRRCNYGNLHVLFAGDFFQLKPINGKPLYLYKSFDLWYKAVNIFLELKTNHRFHEDPEHGNILQKFRNSKLSKDDVRKYNKRVICEYNDITEDDLPDDLVIAVKRNKDRNAIHDAMFVKHLQNTHSKDASVTPPMHTICVMASNLSWKTGQRSYKEMTKFGKDIIYTSCGDDHIRTDGASKSKCIDPNLKLYYNVYLC